jgi:NAD(P)-dependent dehydrogenase (short-subunit alcohol dehydrogenase family)
MRSEKIWFVTGASRGFGRLWVEAALARGDKVAATARNLSALDDLAEQYGASILPLKLDVTDRVGVFKSVNVAHAHFGRLDVILSNAGFGMMGAVEEVSIEDARANFETNVFGTLNLIQAALPLLRTQGSGHIIPVSSVAGVIAVPTAGVYEGAKFAVEGIAEALATEVAAFGIKVTLLEPAAYATDFMSGSSIRTAKPILAYDGVRTRLAEMMKPEDVGDPAATAAAILKLVDSHNPPLRLMLGALLPWVRQVYEDRLRTWESWDEVARAAKGKP